MKPRPSTRQICRRSQSPYNLHSSLSYFLAKNVLPKWERNSASSPCCFRFSAVTELQLVFWSPKNGERTAAPQTLTFKYTQGRRWGPKDYDPVRSTMYFFTRCISFSPKETKTPPNCISPNRLMVSQPLIQLKGVFGQRPISLC